MTSWSITVETVYQTTFTVEAEDVAVAQHEALALAATECASAPTVVVDRVVVDVTAL